MTQYLALLRGINVGGNNVIKMADLKACFERHGFTNIITYIQSGNVIFDAPTDNIDKTTDQVEEMLSRTFSYKAKVVLRSHAQLQQIIDGAPKGFGATPKDFRYYVIFIKEPLTAAEALQKIPLRDGVDQAWTGVGEVVFHQRVEARATQSYLNKLVAMPIYQDMTIRNWNTTTKLMALMEKTKS